MSEVMSTFRLRPGDRAPDFTLCDSDGNRVVLEKVTGVRGLLVVFACNHCPYVIHLAHELGKLAHELKRSEVGTVAINSNDAMNYPDDSPRHMKAFAADHGWGFPYLVDDSQETAMAYGAACTPDFFLFDGNCRLFYAGQFDDSRPGRGQPTGADLRDAVSRMLAGEALSATPRPSSGCNIKWKSGRRPQWWNSGG